jgi:hypothetical protein
MLQRGEGRSLILTKGAPDRFASSSVQHGLFSGYVDFKLHRFHLGPIELWDKRGGDRGRALHGARCCCPGRPTRNVRMKVFSVRRKVSSRSRY